MPVFIKKNYVKKSAIVNNQWMRWMMLITVALHFSCNKGKIPEDILPPEKMQLVMWDLIQVDEFAKNYIVMDSTKNLKKESEKLFEQVFFLHKITREKFNKSFAWYQGRPDMNKIVFDSLGAFTGRKRADLYKPLDSAGRVESPHEGHGQAIQHPFQHLVKLQPVADSLQRPVQGVPTQDSVSKKIQEQQMRKQLPLRRLPAQQQNRNPLKPVATN
jgi:Domain of unknown function (DUF4296)